MRRILSLLSLALLLFAPLSLHADENKDALNVLDEAESKVREVRAYSAITSPDLKSFESAKGELSSLSGFFDRVAAALSKVNIGPGTELVSIGASAQAKISNAGKATTMDFGVFIEACNGLLGTGGDLDHWQNLLPQVRTALQSRLDANTQALIHSQVDQALPPAAAPNVGAGPGVNQPTPTPVFVNNIPTAVAMPTVVVPPAVAATPVPVGDGGVIPGGWVPQPIPTTVYTPIAGVPTMQPTPRAQLKAPVAIAVGHNNQRVWVANVRSNSVGVMEASSQRFVADIPVGSQPQALALDDGDNNLVVANYASNNVSIVDARKDTVLKTLNVGAGPIQVLVVHGHKAYVLCQDSRSVAVIDINLRLLLKSIVLSSRPGRMDQPNSSQQVYVTLPDEDSVAVIDTAYDDVTATIKE